MSWRVLSLKGLSMYYRYDLSVVTQLGSDDIWDVLMALRERGLEKRTWPGTVHDAYETLELAFARTLANGFGPNCAIASKLDDNVWRHAVLVGRDYLMRVGVREPSCAA